LKKQFLLSRDYFLVSLLTITRWNLSADQGLN